MNRIEKYFGTKNKSRQCPSVEVFKPAGKRTDEGRKNQATSFCAEQRHQLELVSMVMTEVQFLLMPNCRPLF